MPAEPPHIRARRVAALERDVASVEGCVVLYDMFSDEGKESVSEMKVLWTRIESDIERIKVDVSLLDTVSKATPTVCDDSVFIGAIQGDIPLLEPILKSIKKRKKDLSGNEWNVKRLHSICTEFVQHLQALGKYYETFPSPWMEDIAVLLGKIQVKLGA